MAVADATVITPLSDADHSRQLRRAVVASTIGTAIEWYDFFLYSVVTGLVFAKLFFPNDDPLAGTLNAFGIYSVGFLARPVGAAIFGHYGDRIGRKSTLIVTLLLMGIATFLVALVPTYEQIGIWGAILLTVLRFIQGIGVGGEWGGSVLMSMEWCAARTAPAASSPRGRSSACPADCSSPTSPCSPSARCPATQFLTWGWRIPFFLSLILVAVGLWIRLGIMETPVFSKLVAERKIEKAPILEVIKRQPKEIMLSALCAHGRTGTVLHLHGVRLRVWRRRAQSVARFPAGGRAGAPPCCRSSPSRCPATSPISSAASACT